MTSFDLVNQFEHVRRWCVVIRVGWAVDHISHNGYVHIPEGSFPDAYWTSITENLDYEGPLWYKGIKHAGERFIGFDSYHVYDTPATQTQEAVTERLKIFAEEINRVMGHPPAPKPSPAPKSRMELVLDVVI